MMEGICLESEKINLKDVREFDISHELLDEVLYLNSHEKDYRWMFFLHEEHHLYSMPCVRETGKVYYNFLLWCKPKKEGHGKFFSNVPFIQYLRQTCLKHQMVMTKSYELFDVVVWVKHLFQSNHRYLCDLSNVQEEIADEFDI